MRGSSAFKPSGSRSTILSGFSRGSSESLSHNQCDWPKCLKHPLLNVMVMTERFVGLVTQQNDRRASHGCAHLLPSPRRAELPAQAHEPARQNPESTNRASSWFPNKT